MQTQSATPSAPVKRATAGFILSLIAGIIDAVVASLLIAAVSFIGQFEDAFSGMGLGLGFGAAEAIVATWGAIGLILVIVIIIGARALPGKEIIGGIVVLVFSLISLPFTFGGLIVALVLGIIGGALGIAKR